ncbi:MAG: glycosyltransferase family 4 protein [Magnetococcales bacterium]|nr:glycosyltransferase family 4 protein [Magnetococcales bacterium]
MSGGAADSSLRVAMVLPDLRRAGAESAVVNLSRTLVRCGVAVDLVVIGARQEYTDELAGSGVRLHCLDLYRQTIRFYRQDKHWQIRRQLERFFRYLAAPIVHMHLFHGLVWAAVAARKAGSLTCYTAHGLDPWLTQQDLISLWRRWLFKRAWRHSGAHLSAVSPSVIQHTAQGLSCDPHSITWLPNSLSAAGWHPPPATKPLGRTIIMVGTLYPLKRVSTGIQALALLPEALLWVVGDGPQRSALQQLAAAQGVMERVTFLGVRTDLPELLQSADLFWLLSEREGMPMVALEAMASGLPVVATAVPGTRDLLRHEENSLLVALDQPQQVAAATRRLWQEESVRQRLIAEGLATAALYESGRIARQHIAYYQGLREMESGCHGVCHKP